MLFNAKRLFLLLIPVLTLLLITSIAGLIYYSKQNQAHQTEHRQQREARQQPDQQYQVVAPAFGRRRPPVESERSVDRSTNYTMTSIQNLVRLRQPEQQTQESYHTNQTSHQSLSLDQHHHHHHHHNKTLQRRQPLADHNHYHYHHNHNHDDGAQPPVATNTSIRMSHHTPQSPPPPFPQLNEPLTRARVDSAGREIVERLMLHQIIDILLDRNNCILFNRCSNSRLYIQIDLRTKTGTIGTQQLPANEQLPDSELIYFTLTNDDQSARSIVMGLSQKYSGRLESIKMKILSMIITIESVKMTTTTKTLESQEKQKHHQGATQQAMTSRADGATSKQAKPPPRHKSNEVKLRANLTELYICLDEQHESFETRVNGSSLNCHFNELTIDHRHVKYQSVANTSLFLGFDAEGYPVCGHSSDHFEPLADGSLGRLTTSHSQSTKTNDNIPTQADGMSQDTSGGGGGGGGGSNQTADHMTAVEVEQVANDDSERCYLFTKMNRITTSTHYFPEAFELIANEQLSGGNSLAGPEGPPANSTARKIHEAAELAKRRATSALAPRHSFEQGRLVNMKRYRNILRFQLGRSANQTIVPASGAKRKLPVALSGGHAAKATSNRSKARSKSAGARAGRAGRRRKKKKKKQQQQRPTMVRPPK